MKDTLTRLNRVLIGCLLSILPVLLLEGVRSATGSGFSWSGSFIRWVYIIVVMLLAWLGAPHQITGRSWCWPLSGLVLISLGILVGLGYALTLSTVAAWLFIAIFYALMLDIDLVMASQKGFIYRWLIHGALALAVGFGTSAITQIETHFSEEEFFIALQALELSFFWLVLRAVWYKISSFTQLAAVSQPWNSVKLYRLSLRFSSHWLALGLVTLSVLSIILTIRSYQLSFFPPEAPPYPGISANSPFLCGKTDPDLQTYDGLNVFHRLLAQVEANPYKGVPEYGMLALGTGDIHWADTFHDSILAEAQQRKFTEPANSVKAIQFEAALRAYYYARVRVAFPDLFTLTEQEILRQWFAAVNKRAWTTEWVDWMYALAFTKWPQGPYENQENGAGLLALLESQGLADPSLSEKNRTYLANNPRGWIERFRVTDDAIIYQPAWIINAYYQSLYTNQTDIEKRRLSFEWIVLQALPDGAPLQYNYFGDVPLDNVTYFGGKLLNDAQEVWLAGRALDYHQLHQGDVYAQPGLETATDLLGISPGWGSCLLYGDSGLPNQKGPLAPDKVVFRDGWTTASKYILVNLRFSGWHRYKATNSISLIYQAGPITGEKLDSEAISWLPQGRSLFRDKRIPRENLNGLVVERIGTDAVVYNLTGIGGPWAQNPPYYATVERFETGTQMDTSTTVIQDWNGWTQHRGIYFYHNGPIVVVDLAKGPQKSQAAIVWQFNIPSENQELRFLLRAGEHPAEVVIVPLTGEVVKEPNRFWVQGPGQISLVTVFLTDEWIGAKVLPTIDTLRISSTSETISIPLGMP